MADLHGAAEKDPVSVASASWLIRRPASPANGMLVLVVNAKPKAAVLTSPGAEWTKLDRAQGSGPGRLHVYYRSTPSGLGAGPQTLTWNAPAAGSWVCLALSSAAFHSASAWVYQEGGASVSMPTMASPGAGAVRVDVLGSDEWPRIYLPAAGSGITPVHEPCPLNGPGTTVGARVIGAGSSEGAAYVPDDPSDGEDRDYVAGSDWCRTLGISLIFRDAAAPPPTGGAQSGVVGSASIVAFSTASVGVTAPAGPAGGSRVLLVYHMRQSAVVAGEIPGWTLRWANDASDGWGNRLYCYTQSLTAAAGASAVTIPMTATGDVRGVVVAVAHSGPVEAVVGASTGYQTSLTTPAATVSRALSSYMTVGASANFHRTLSISGPTQLSVPNGILADRGHCLGVAHGPAAASQSFTPPAWTPSDPGGGSAGDAWRALTLVFGPAGSSDPGPPPTGSVTIDADGGFVYVAAPENLRSSSATSNSLVWTWDDLSSNETGFRLVLTNRATREERVVTTAANVRTATTSGLAPGSAYDARVYALAGSDESAPAYGSGTTVGAGFTATLGPLAGSVLARDEVVTLHLRTTPAVPGRAITWSMAPAGIVQWVVTPPGATNSLGEATAQVRGISDGGSVVITASVDGIRATATLTATALHEVVTLTISPSRIERDGVAMAIVSGSLGGGQLIGRNVSLLTSAAGIVPGSATVKILDDGNGYGRARIPLRGIGDGTAIIRASVEGMPIPAPVPILVANRSEPAVYEASGVSVAVITAETPLARGRRPRVERLTSEDLKARFPDDQGLDFANEMGNAEVTFFRKAVIAAHQAAGGS